MLHLDATALPVYLGAMPINPQTTVRKSITLPKEIWERVRRHRLECQFKTEAQAIRHLVEIGIEAKIPDSLKNNMRFPIPRKRLKDELEYTTQVGRVVLKWNNVIESIVMFLIALKFDYGDDITSYLENWQKNRSDESKRRILKNELITSAKIEAWIRSECLWCLDQLSDLQLYRNDVVHTPIGYYSSKAYPFASGDVSML